MPLTRTVVVIVLVAGLLAIGGVAVASSWTPTVPQDAASTVIAQAVASGEVLPDPDPDDPDLPQYVQSPSGQDCLARITEPSGWLDLCWAVVRKADLDPQKDYYQLSVYGTLSGSGSGVRWWRVSADPLAEVMDEVWFGWPDGVYEGGCEDQVAALDLTVGSSPHETICGRTVGASDGRPYGWQATWTCVGCIFPDHSDQPVALYGSIGVRQGTVPAWNIGAAFGD